MRGYNAAEQRLSGLDPNHVVGKSFFTDIAPCTRVREFEGEFHKVAAGEIDHASLTFVFKFSSAEVVVNVGLTYDARRDAGSILVQKVG